MKKSVGKNIILFLTFLLSLLGFSFFALRVSAQDSNISISARVLGCGDNVVSPFLGEQCEGPNTSSAILNGESCLSLGFDSGSLLCTNACVFDISNCSDEGGPDIPGSGGGTPPPTDNSGGSGSSTSSRKRFEKNSEKLNTKNLIFSGVAKGSEHVIVLNDGAYYASVQVENSGNFSLVVSDYNPGEHNFSFYSISSELGKSELEFFSIDLPESSTIVIDDIHLIHPEEIKKIPLIVSGDFDKGKDDVLREIRNPLYNILTVRILNTDSLKSKEPVVINFALGALISLIIYLFFFVRRLFI